MPSVRVSLESSELSFVEEIVAAEHGDRRAGLPDGVSLRVENRSARHGVSGSTILLDFVLTTTSGIAANVIAALICEKWRRRSRRIRVVHEDVTGQPAGQVEQVVAKALEKAGG